MALFIFLTVSSMTRWCMIGLMQRATAKKMRFFGQLTGLAIVLIVTNACAAPVNDAASPEGVGDDLYFVRGYRSENDPCKLTGETAFTNQFLDDSADLVSCPTGHEGGSELIDSRRAVVVAQKDGYTLYTVPRR